MYWGAKLKERLHLGQRQTVTVVEAKENRENHRLTPRISAEK